MDKSDFAELKRRRPRRTTKKPPDGLFIALWELGLNDTDIARLLGASAAAAGMWRRTIDLEAHPCTKQMLDPATGRPIQREELIARGQEILENWKENGGEKA